MGYRRYTARLIVSVVALIFYLFTLYPVPAIVTSVVLIAGYLLFTHLTRQRSIETGEAIRRRTALDTAKIYLAPYTDIWRNLKLSNRFCQIRLGTDGTTITAKEKGKDLTSYRTFKIVSSKVHSPIDLWNMFCINFSHNKTYDGLVEDCKLYRVVIKESVVATSYAPSYKSKNLKPAERFSAQVEEKIDVNNASEIELTELPGISIVMAKKIIKKREEINGFKNVNEFFVFLKLKPHMEEQLRNLVVVKKMQGSVKIERFTERNVDL